MSVPEDENFMPATMTENMIYVGRRKYVAADLPPTLSAAISVPEVAAIVEAANNQLTTLEAYMGGMGGEHAAELALASLQADQRLRNALAALDAAKQQKGPADD